MEVAISAHSLWAAVVMRAVYDIEAAELDSTTYEQACSFFTAPGEWAESRLAIADCLGMHTDDVARIGKRAIVARRLAEGLPLELEKLVPVVPEPPLPPVPVMLPLATFKPVEKKPAKVKVPRGGWGTNTWKWSDTNTGINPFAVRYKV